MKKNETVLNEKIITACQLPKDVFLGASLISVTGNNELIVENFKNIVKYFPEMILLQCKNYQLCIMGEGMYIECYCKEELKIKGNILEIKFLMGSKS